MRRCWKDLNFQVSANGVHDLQGVWILVPIIVWTVQINLELLKRPHHKRVIVFMNVGGETRTSSHSATKHKRLFEVWFQKARAILSFRLSWDCPSDPSNTLVQFPVRGHIQQASVFADFSSGLFGAFRGYSASWRADELNESTSRKVVKSSRTRHKFNQVNISLKR